MSAGADEQRREVRKIHRYPNGGLVRTDRIALERETSLKVEPLLTFEAIEAHWEFPCTASDSSKSLTIFGPRPGGAV